ncbi:unnamed protein product [Brassica rapa]|uniref:Uncharacterized protein n=1 Tax=Brassica campestris TaxID=3711 RepID=A0A8D9M6S4_BRACM|nr:unnamed protein product [Brassica rapa]
MRISSRYTIYNKFDRKAYGFRRRKEQRKSRKISRSGERLVCVSVGGGKCKKKKSSTTLISH